MSAKELMIATVGCFVILFRLLVVQDTLSQVGCHLRIVPGPPRGQDHNVTGIESSRLGPCVDGYQTVLRSDGSETAYRFVCAAKPAEPERTLICPTFRQRSEAYSWVGLQLLAIASGVAAMVINARTHTKRGILAGALVIPYQPGLLIWPAAMGVVGIIWTLGELYLILGTSAPEPSSPPGRRMTRVRDSAGRFA